MFSGLFIFIYFNIAWGFMQIKNSPLLDITDGHLYPIITREGEEEISLCQNFPMCHSMNLFKRLTKERLPIASLPSQRRSYYNGYGAPSSPTYYPTFDPISVLASLAFLAFLLQLFTSLFDRSRSILPTIVSSRQSENFETSEIAKRILSALDEYGSLNEKVLMKNN